MILDNLYLEITRNCTIGCEHCLRGEREPKNMSSETLENIFKNIKEVKNLLLSGGEPLIGFPALEKISNLIKKYNITVYRISIITNGTVCSSRQINAIQSLKNNCQELDLFLSSDLFHRLEWKKLGLEEQVKRNYDIYKNLFNMKKYLENDRYHHISLSPKGRAEHLTSERIKEITKNQYIQYEFNNIPMNEKLDYEENTIHGKLCIDVNGYLVDYSMSFEEEDTFAEHGYNINQFPLQVAAHKYIEEYKERNKIAQKTKSYRHY